MSGDLQARKRREKKKRKEDAPDIIPLQAPQISPVVSDDVNIHVHKEVSTGGGLCAKFIFFILLSLLAALIGLIITEHRGLTDLDTINTDSQFAQIFEGWIDKSIDSHDAHSELNLEDEDDDHLEDDRSEEAPESVEEDEESHHDDDESGLADETAEDEESVLEDETAEDEDSEVLDETAEDDESTIPDETVEEEESTVQDETVEEEESALVDETAEEDDSELTDETVEDEQSLAPSDTFEEEEDSRVPDETAEADELMLQDETAEADESMLQDDTAEDDDSNNQTTETEEPNDETAEDETTENPNEDTVEEANDETAENDESTLEETTEYSNVQENESILPETTENDNASREDDQDESTREDEETVEKLLVDKIHSEDAADEVGEEKENSNVVVKFGVGMALLVVAYVVLIKKWKTDEATSDKSDDVQDVDLTRRNTIVVPPDFDQVEQEIVNEEEEYSEEYDSEAEEIAQTKLYEDLQAKYDFNTLSPGWVSKEERGRVDDYEDEEEEDDVEYEDEEEHEEIEEDEEEQENDEDEQANEELLQRLEAKYGKIYHSESEDEMDEYEVEDKDEAYDAWKRVKVYPEDEVSESDSGDEQPVQTSGAQSLYPFANITNSLDWNVRKNLDHAQDNLARDAAYALTLFNKILESHPYSPRALYGKAQSLDILAEQKRSNKYLNQAISTYQEVLKITDVPEHLFRLAAERCIDRMSFRGLHSQAISIHQELIEKFPGQITFRNHLAVTYLTINNIEEARELLRDTLTKWPSDGFALVHYGFILKTSDNNLEQGVAYLKRGIATNDPGVIDGRFYFHLGDALTRLSRNSEALQIYQQGVKHKLFLSKYQRSLYNVNRLKGQPWWTKEETSHTNFLNKLEENWSVIRKEGLNVLSKEGYFLSETENLRDKGDWKQFELFARGVKHQKNCKQCPQTCSLIETLSDAVGCKRGQIKFSVMHPGTHIWPHCGPTNCRLRIHLGLKIPLDTFIRVGEETRTWQDGKVIIFDDSFEHEVWHNGTSVRLVLIVDIWHPALTAAEKRSLSSI